MSTHSSEDFLRNEVVRTSLQSAAVHNAITEQAKQAKLRLKGMSAFATLLQCLVYLSPEERNGYIQHLQDANAALNGTDEKVHQEHPDSETREAHLAAGKSLLRKLSGGADVGKATDAYVNTLTKHAIAQRNMEQLDLTLADVLPVIEEHGSKAAAAKR